MNIPEFQAKWHGATLKKRSASQEHFLDLCHALNVPTPAQADPNGTFYAFERGAEKTDGGDGQIATGEARRVGLLATQSIRKGAGRAARQESPG